MDEQKFQLLLTFYMQETKFTHLQIIAQGNNWEMHLDGNENVEDEWKVIHIARGEQLVELLLKNVRQYFAMKDVYYECQENLLIHCTHCQKELSVASKPASKGHKLEKFLDELSPQWQQLRDAIINDPLQVE